MGLGNATVCGVGVRSMIAPSAVGARYAHASLAPNVVTIFFACECFPDIKPPACSDAGTRTRGDDARLSGRDNVNGSKWRWRRSLCKDATMLTNAANHRTLRNICSRG